MAKKRAVGIISAVMSVGAIIASLLFLRFDDASLLWIAMFPLSGAFGYIAARWLGLEGCLGFAVPSAVLFVGVPFAFGLTKWWFGGGGIVVWFTIFFCLMIIGGWLLVCLPVMIADKHPEKSRRERNFNRIRLFILFAIVAVLLFLILDLCFGNPVTAFIAGEEMRDWLEEQAESGVVYEIKGRHLPRYEWYNTEYVFDLTDGRSRYVLHWNEGKIRIDTGNW